MTTLARHLNFAFDCICRNFSTSNEVNSFLGLTESKVRPKNEVARKFFLPCVQMCACAFACVCVCVCVCIWVRVCVRANRVKKPRPRRHEGGLQTRPSLSFSQNVSAQERSTLSFLYLNNFFGFPRFKKSPFSCQQKYSRNATFSFKFLFCFYNPVFLFSVF